METTSVATVSATTKCKTHHWNKIINNNNNHDDNNNKDVDDVDDNDDDDDDNDTRDSCGEIPKLSISFPPFSIFIVP